MSKYKVNIDTELPSDETIKKSMDFDKVYKEAGKNYNLLSARKDMHKKRKYIMLVVVVVSLGLVLVLGLQ